MSLVTLATAKEYLKVTSSDATQEALIQALIDYAEDSIKRFVGTEFAVTTKTEVFTGGVRYFVGSWRPIVAVTSLYHATSEYTYASDEYIVIDGCIFPASSSTLASGRWPSGDYQIVYTAGYAAASVPAGIKSAILLMVARMWANRGGLQGEGAGTGGNQSWAALLAPGGDLDTLLAPYRALAIGR